MHFMVSLFREDLRQEEGTRMSWYLGQWVCFCDQEGLRREGKGVVGWSVRDSQTVVL